MREKNWLHFFATAIAAIGVIGSLIAGQVYAIPDIYAYLPTTHYNWSLMIIGEISTLFVSAFFFALASILEQTQTIAENSRIIRNNLANNSALGSIEVQKSIDNNPLVENDDSYKTCPSCGRKMKKECKLCLWCGTTFADDK